MNAAIANVACIQREEYHYAAGGLIALVRYPERAKMYEDFANSGTVDIAYHIGPDGEDGAYLYFKLYNP